jgi:hypothetical protein
LKLLSKLLIATPSPIYPLVRELRSALGRWFVIKNYGGSYRIEYSKPVVPYANTLGSIGFHLDEDHWEIKGRFIEMNVNLHGFPELMDTLEDWIAIHNFKPLNPDSGWQGFYYKEIK